MLPGRTSQSSSPRRAERSLPAWTLPLLSAGLARQFGFLAYNTHNKAWKLERGAAAQPRRRDVDGAVMSFRRGLVGGAAGAEPVGWAGRLTVWDI
jgi:hypothetical protein